MKTYKSALDMIEDINACRFFAGEIIIAANAVWEVSTVECGVPIFRFIGE